MQTLRSHAELLARADGADGLGPLAALLGFGALSELDARARSALGIPDELRTARIARGQGALRLLVVEMPAGAPPREALATLAARLAARAPQLLWLVAASEHGGRQVGLAAWSAERHPPRVAALVADRERVVESDAETLRALAAARDASDALTHARWVEVLGRDALTRRFYGALEEVVAALATGAEGRAGAPERREVALLYVSRLLFLAFLEAKGWLDGDPGFLARSWTACMRDGGHYHRRVLLPLFFGTLNTPPHRRAPAARALGRIPFLNGGLFAVTPAERRASGLRFPDELLGRVHGELLGRYRFTAREDGARWSEAAVDPEMLGRAFESLMAARERKAGGVFYTPQALVERVTGEALAEALLGALPRAPRALRAAVERALADGAPLPDDARPAVASVAAELRVLDPACGSGAFLVHALERLSDLLRRAGDARPLADLRRAVLTRSIFGVDVHPTAVWLCELRLWLSAVIEREEADPWRVPPLPNLDHHVRVGDSLLGGGFDARAGGAGRLVVLRERYARCTGRRKIALARALDAVERREALRAHDAALARVAAERRERLAALRARDLFGERHHPERGERARLDELRREARALRAARRRLAEGGALPFAFASHFADAATRGGFDVVLGNPPWVRPHHVPPAVRERLRREYRVLRDGAWREGAAGAGAGRGFAAQVDLAALFVERGVALLRPGGTLAFLLPAKLWRALAGGGVRRLVAEETEPRILEDWSEARALFDAAVYPSLLVARRRGPADFDGPHARAMRVAVRDRAREVAWRAPACGLPLDGSPASPWLLAPPDVRHAFDLVAQTGTPLAASRFGRPLLGVKCGCNEPFVVRVLAREHARGAGRNHPTTDDHAGGAGEALHARVRSHATGERARTGRVEAALLRPLVRGESLGAWRAGASGEWIVWTHDARGDPLARLPALTARWLAGWRHQLAARSDLRGRARWWSLFRVEGAAADRPRVVWRDLGRTPRAAVLEAGDPTVPLNSCYVVRCPAREDALALAALLNAPLAAAWLALVAEPARGGYHRYMGWTMALLPLPADWERARGILAPLAERALAGASPPPDALLAAALDAHRLRARDVAPLLEWTAR